MGAQRETDREFGLPPGRHVESVASGSAVPGTWRLLSLLALMVSFMGPEWVLAQSPGTAALLASTPFRVVPSDPVMPGGGGVDFGAAVALDGDLLVVGAPKEWGTGAPPGTSGTGAAYVFARTGDTWVETQKLRADVETAFENFGTSVAIARGSDIDGPLDVLVVGAPGFNAGEGRVHVFHRRPGELWQHEIVLQAVASSSGGLFGTSVAIDWFVGPNSVNGDPTFIIAVGAPIDNGQRGSVSVFQRGGGPPNWVPTPQVFYGMDAADRIGSAVAMGGPDIMAAGDGIDVPGGFNDGGAQTVRQQNFGGTGFVYALNWELQPSTPTLPIGIGEAAALFYTPSDSGTGVLGAPLDDSDGQNDRGKVFVFDLTPGGVGTTRFESASFLGASSGQRLGVAVAVSQRLLLAASAGTDAFGAVEVYERGVDKTDWTHVGAFDTPPPPAPLLPCLVGSTNNPQSIALQDTTVVIGCTAGSGDSEGVYIYFSVPMFEDGFESGDLTAWSGSSP